MEKKTMIAAVALVVLLIMSSNGLTLVESQGVDCLDSCSTGCVNRDNSLNYTYQFAQIFSARLMQRCERKCQIRCSPDRSVDDHLD
ncbi:hypothetical protein L2E82_24834 [Cichorium intybus]|uniref:Uncharacterized protein n=1 Tax=Cichorium intybus TaxID=13427 RepID=A0ACB9E1Y3_CICIN|nr:hypothetical protein L2E82_24834 [Cichorium intybus]